MRVKPHAPLDDGFTPCELHRLARNNDLDAMGATK
jgi:hypothetical protein